MKYLAVRNPLVDARTEDSRNDDMLKSKQRAASTYNTDSEQGEGGGVEGVNSADDMWAGSDEKGQK